MARGVNNTIVLPAGILLDILVENMGRVNYGRYLRDLKGIPDGVIWQGQYVSNWETFPLPMNQLSSLPFTPSYTTSGPAFYQGKFNITGATPLLDTYLVTLGWTKGNAWVNGFNVGRYWNVGPQYSLYVPAAILKVGENEVIVFETEITDSLSVTFQTTPVYA